LPRQTTFYKGVQTSNNSHNLRDKFADSPMSKTGAGGNGVFTLLALPERPIVLKKRPANYFSQFQKYRFAAFEAAFKDRVLRSEDFLSAIQLDGRQIHRALPRVIG
jgi:hypothetical protein